MREEFTVRPATADDAAAVEAVARSSWHAAYDDLLGAATVEDTVAEWYDVGRLAEAARDDEHVFHVAEAEDGVGHESAGDDEIVAFAHAVPDDEEDDLARLLRLYADPEWWRTGVGTALLERTESRLRERGFERL